MAEGATHLSNVELLAILLRTGSPEETALHLAERILAYYDGLNGLAQVNAAELQEKHGIGSAKSTQIVAALELSKRLLTVRTSPRPSIISAGDAARYLDDMSSLRQENVRVILLDSARRVIAAPTVYIGTINASLLRAAEIFREAITYNSPAIILAHNHPSGDPTPSPEDVELTRSLASAGRLLDIVLVDHIIIGEQSYASLREMGFLP